MGKAQNEAERRVKVLWVERENPLAIRAVQWRTRFNTVERKLLQVRAYLRYLPQDLDLRKECETLETICKALLEEAP